MTKYFQVVVKLKREDDKGKLKTITERYLVDALTITEAEARVVKFMVDSMLDYEISSATESRIMQILSQNETPEVYG